MVPGSVRNWIAVNAVQQSNLNEKMKTKMTTPHTINSNSRSPLRLGFLLIPLVLAWFALSPTAQAQLPSPSPDGGYPGNNTAEGDGALFSLTTGVNNTALGAGALTSNTTGSYNTATGYSALFFNTGFSNTANGFQALYGNTTGGGNTANGLNALFNNTTGDHNTAGGADTLYFNTTGNENTANGAQALQRNTTGTDNTANGFQALFSNTTGPNNTATGVQALYSNTSGSSNTANGFGALFTNTSGINNTANGNAALESNTTGNGNTADGQGALISNTTGSENTAIGDKALQSNTIGTNNTADGENSLLSNTTGSSNIALGFNAGTNLTTGSSNIDIGNAGVAAEANTIRIGTVGTQTRAFIAGISGTGVSGMALKINSSGQLGVAPSSARFKQDIQVMGDASDALLALKPVTFRYKKELDPEGIPQFGLVAEDVEKVNPDLVARDAKGKVYTVRYEAVNAMLLNEFLKEHQKVQQLEKQIENLTAGLQKVSDQFELSKPAPRVVDSH
jgi:trimeric autotransporter adhesin